MAAIALTVKSKSVTVSLTEQNVHLTPVFHQEHDRNRHLAAVARLDATYVQSLHLPTANTRYSVRLRPA